MIFLIGTSDVRAAEWTIIPASSSISIASDQMGQPFAGRFARFGGRISFEPGSEPSGAVHVEIDVTSLTTGKADRDAMAQGADWFAAARNPKAVFEAHQFRRTEERNYLAMGSLTIKGVTLPLSLPFTLEVDQTGRAEMRAQVALDRTTFGIGSGQFADAAIAGHSVVVRMTIQAHRKS